MHTKQIELTVGHSMVCMGMAIRKTTFTKRDISVDVCISTIAKGGLSINRNWNH